VQVLPRKVQFFETKNYLASGYVYSFVIVGEDDIYYLIWGFPDNHTSDFVYFPTDWSQKNEFWVTILFIEYISFRNVKLELSVSVSRPLFRVGSNVNWYGSMKRAAMGS
jgi:hypothetical protein